MYWTVRSPRWVYLFGDLMLAAGAMACVLSLWPVMHEQWLARGLLVLILALVSSKIIISRRKRDVMRAGQVCSIRRLAKNDWHITFADGRILAGSLCRAWKGWGWVTVKIRSHDSSRPCECTVTLWRGTVSAVAWHRLQVWTTWELGMAQFRAQEARQ